MTLPSNKRAAPKPASAKRAKPGSRKASNTRREMVEAEVLEKAAILFSRRGLAGTNLEDVAKEVGLSRTSIYHYFPSKEALLHALVHGSMRPAESIFVDLAATPETPVVERIRAAARRLVMWITDPNTRFRIAERAENELPEEYAEIARATRRRVLEGMRALITEGIETGALRPVDVNLSAFAILGMCNWTAWWFSPQGALSRSEIAEGIADMAVTSLERAPRAGHVQSLESLTAAIRENLKLIEKFHG